MDIASSSLGEKHAVYGGGPNLKLGLTNVMSKYGARMIGIASTCLTETIGDNVPMLVREFKDEFADVMREHGNPVLVNVSTPSYSGSHMDGFHAAVQQVVEQIAEEVPRHDGIGLFPGFLSPADIRYLKEVMEAFGLTATILPDISLALDAPALLDYEKLPSGGTPISDIRRLGGARSVIEFGRSISESATVAKSLEKRFSVPTFRLGTPIGLRETDAFFQALEEISGENTPELHLLERGRLVDSYVDGHKYLFDQRAVIYGEEDLVIGLTAFLAEIGVKPVLCASGGRSRRMEESIREVTDGLLPEAPIVMEGVDFYEIEEYAEKQNPQLLIGHSKGYQLSRRWKIPLVRVGFPIHDRFGGHRTLHLGYRGAQMLLDRIVNAVIEAKQENSHVGYSYM
jgi:nitrogenase molybdenum-iron protein NifN